MATLTLRNDKGAPLTLTEMDNNLSNLNDQLPSSLSFSNGTLTVTKEDTNTLTVDLDGRYLELSGGTMSGSLTVTGDITATGDINSQSDARVKENVETVDSALEKVESMRGVYYNRIGEVDRKLGMIAQEVESVIPEVVREGEDGLKSISYANVTGLLIEAIKELSAEVKELKSLNSK